MINNVLLLGLRTTHNYTTKEVSAKAGMPEEHYTNLEQGKVLLKIDDALKLSTVYKIEPEILLQSLSGTAYYNSGVNSKGVIYATHYFEGLKVSDIAELKKEGVL